jgi:hypothetical protein
VCKIEFHDSLPCKDDDDCFVEQERSADGGIHATLGLQ